MMMVDYGVWTIINQSRAQLRHKRKFKAELTVDELFNCGYKTERERIKLNTHKYADKSVVEAFEEAYDIKVSDNVREKVDVVPMDLMLGQTIFLNITSITDDGVVFDPGNYKATFITRNNLSRYPKFKEFLPTRPVPCRVIEIKPNHVVVDIIGPMVDQYVLPYAKEPWRQNKLEKYQPVLVRNLHLVNGGFLGKAVIPTVSEWLGQEYMVDAFIPGSQIVQNTTDDFEQFEGRSLEAFIIGYSPKPYSGGMSLICSVKNWIKHKGNLKMMQIFKWWCEQGLNGVPPRWETYKKEEFDGFVTGILNSSQKCGVFVEVPELDMTGMINVKASKLSEYHPGDMLVVRWDDFDERMAYNDEVGQMQHLPPFEVVDGAIKSVNVKPIFKEVIY